MNFKRMILTLAIAVSFFTAAGACFADPPSNDYTLVWSDEFDGDKLSEADWHHHQLGVRHDAFNTKEAASLDGQGNLLITTSKNGDRYETAMLDTFGKHEFTYGYFECRVKMQTTPGFWSAFWLMPCAMKVSDPPDPAHGGVEIDIFEYLCNSPDKLKHNFHWNGYKPGEHKQISAGDIPMEGLGEGFHLIGMEWTPTEYVMYCDGKETYRLTEAVSQVPSYPIISCEIGPWAGDIEKFEANLPNVLTVDYIRVYQKK